MSLSDGNENHLEEKKMKYSEILEIMSSTEFAVKNSLVTKDVIDEWESVPDDQFDIEYDVEITDEEWADFCEWYEEVARMVRVAKTTPRFWVYGEFVECGDEDEI